MMATATGERVHLQDDLDVQTVVWRRPPRTPPPSDAPVEDSSTAPTTPVVTTALSEPARPADAEAEQAAAWSRASAEAARPSVEESPLASQLPASNRASDDDAPFCVICLDTGDGTMARQMLGCGHVYCRDCLNQYISSRQTQHLDLACPICKRVATDEEVVAILEGAAPSPDAEPLGWSRWTPARQEPRTAHPYEPRIRPEDPWGPWRGGIPGDRREPGPQHWYLDSFNLPPVFSQVASPNGAGGRGGGDALGAQLDEQWREHVRERVSSTASNAASSAPRGGATGTARNRRSPRTLGDRVGAWVSLALAAPEMLFALTLEALDSEPSRPTRTPSRMARARSRAGQETESI